MYYVIESVPRLTNQRTVKTTVPFHLKFLGNILFTACITAIRKDFSKSKFLKVETA